MIHQLDENGTMAVVLPHGVLFRAAAEGHIRKHLIKDKNYLDAVIGLPANIFYGTPIQTCILVFKKNRKHKDNLLFIDASQMFGKTTNQSYLRESDIQDILNAYDKREFKKQLSYVANIDEIEQENEFNLSIPRYVDMFEPEEEVSISEVSRKVKDLDFAIQNIDVDIKSFCNELNIPTIVGDRG